MPDKKSTLKTGTARIRALVVSPVTGVPRAGLRTPEARLNEAKGLARAIGLDIVGAETVRVQRPRPSTYFGRGVVERLGDWVTGDDVALVVVDTALSPVQQRNLENAWRTKVIDRSALILEIFGARAQTREGRLQVELAHLTYQRSRLVRSWTHLERQRGGFGFLGGPGERQIELDRRLIGQRIARLKRELETVRTRRELQRKARHKVPYPVIALVGYTNAGKSTLFNRLTGADVYADDALFATLDPTMRRIGLPAGQAAILSDTVGFISDLPTDLVAAFRATLEELTGAELVVHVRDISHPDTEAQRDDVHRVMRNLGLDDAVEGGLIEVLNKIDLLDPAARRALGQTTGRGNRPQVALSARTGEGCENLLDVCETRLGAGRQRRRYDLTPDDGAAIAWLYDHGEVLERRDGEDGTVCLEVRLATADAARFERRLARRPPPSS